MLPFFSFVSFPCSSADHDWNWPPCKVVFFRLAANTLNVRNNNNNNNNSNNNDNNNTARCDDCTYIHTYAFGLQATHKPTL